jgi:NAD(P)-dependent dehydrogenase (short-subunit alcohol dehydrogenase family)
MIDPDQNRAGRSRDSARIRSEAMNRLENKTFIVTGGALGIGRACVEHLVAEGARVAIFDVLDDPAAQLLAQLQDNAAAVRYWHVDVADEHAVATAVAAAFDHFGALHGLVNNAGISGTTKPTHEVTEAEWDRVMAVNVKGVFFCTKHVIPYLRQGGGSIVNLSSIYGLVGAPDVPPYHASKGAVRLMSKTDAMLYAADRIRVNSVHPGYIWTPMVEHHLQASGATDLAAARAEGRPPASTGADGRTQRHRLGRRVSALG